MECQQVVEYLKEKKQELADEEESAAKAALGPIPVELHMLETSCEHKPSNLRCQGFPMYELFAAAYSGCLHCVRRWCTEDPSLLSACSPC